MGGPDSLDRGRRDDGYWNDPQSADPRAATSDPAHSHEAIGAGVVLGGKYRLISEIGRGGMGAVWRAEHLEWEAPVALKIMNRDITAHPEAVARFEREVRLAAGLRSPHVVQVLDHGVDHATRTPYIAMESRSRGASSAAGA
jgi:serine/threonine protein kinase